MDLQAVLTELEANGGGQGIAGLSNKIGTDHSLATGLWATGNHDARILATLVADEKQVDDTLIDGWSADAGNEELTDAVRKLASRVHASSSDGELLSDSMSEPAVLPQTVSVINSALPSAAPKSSGAKKKSSRPAAGKSSKKKKATAKKKAAKPAGKKSAKKAGKKSKNKVAKKAVGKKKTAKKATKKAAKKAGKKKARKK